MEAYYLVAPIEAEKSLMPRLKLDDVPEGEARVFEIDGRRFLVCRDGGSVVATDEYCPHQRLSLDGARVRRGSLFCPHHGARFSLADGRSLSPVTTCPLRLLPTWIEGDAVEIDG